MNENRGMKNMDQTSNNQNESDEIKMSRGSVDANEGSLGSGKKKKTPFIRDKGGGGSPQKQNTLLFL